MKELNWVRLKAVLAATSAVWLGVLSDMAYRAVSEMLTVHNEKEENDAKIEEIITDNLQIYIDRKNALEEEVKKLTWENTVQIVDDEFNLKDLIVIEHDNLENQSYLYILEKQREPDEYEEYHHNFMALSSIDNSEKYSNSCDNFIRFTESEPLFDYLNSDEMAEVTDGKLTTSQLDNISSRINSLCKENNNEKIFTKSMDNK